MFARETEPLEGAVSGSMATLGQLQKCKTTVFVVENFIFEEKCARDYAASGCRNMGIIGLKFGSIPLIATSRY